MARWGALILAAGRGTRMNSAVPKVLHPLCGLPLVSHVFNAVSVFYWDKTYESSSNIVIVPPDHRGIRDLLNTQVEYVVQNPANGTGSAVALAEQNLKEKVDYLLIINADLPLILPDTLHQLGETFLTSDASVALITTTAEQLNGLGVIRRNTNGEITDVVEVTEIDESIHQQETFETNVGAYCFKANWLWNELPKLEVGPNGETYLTKLIAVASRQGAGVADIQVRHSWEAIGINTRVDLANAELALRHRIREYWMFKGVTMMDPSTTYIDTQVSLGRDVQIWPNTFVLGNTKIGENSQIGPNAVIRNSIVGAQCQINAVSLEESTLEDSVKIGPYAHLREHSYIEKGTYIGNFAEVKNSHLGRDVKMGHFSYVGDAAVGTGTNIGAGVITCNYDGEDKHHTEIGDHAFIGSDTMLVAPVRIGSRSRTGAGSVVTKDVPDGVSVFGVPARVNKRRNADGK